MIGANTMGQTAIKHVTGIAESTRPAPTAETQTTRLPGEGLADERTYLSRTHNWRARVVITHRNTVTWLHGTQ